MDRYPLLESLTLPADIKKLTYEQLEELAEETRRLIVGTTSVTGGHLASSLGVVELTIALFRTCEPINDRIIWDVSHQSYPHKILTDRFKRFHTLRTYGGISGFTKPEESPYDAFVAGHASTSISAGLGIVCADEVAGRSRKVVSVIGDGAISGGMAFEALNNLGSMKKPMVVVLNANEMSISRNVGALSSSLSRMITGGVAHNMRDDMREFLKAVPLGDKLWGLARKLEDSALSFFTPGILFEELGLRYIGPIDGHNIREIERALSVAFSHDKPAIVHIVTTKGKGYAPAEKNPSAFHGVSSFDVATGAPKKFGGGKTWTQAFGEKLVSMAEGDSSVVAITAAMMDGTGLNEFAKKFPNRFFDTGIAEEHAMTFAAGLAIAGAKPYIALYSTFLQRAFDQMIHDVALQDLPVRICIDRAGLVGQDGPTHHGAFDISFLRIIPNMAVLLPRDLNELELMMEFSLNYDKPMAIRYARGTACDVDIPAAPIELGEPEVIADNGDYAVVSAGHIFDESYKFWNKLKESGVNAAFINLRFANPLNKERLIELLSDKKAVYIFEENVKTGGVGEMIALLLADYPVKVQILALPDEFITHGSTAELRSACGLTAEHAWEVFQCTKS
ncbi:MAG: 1-deoxy-D-xylulose-5-phosphate synthase [Deferribacteraceae bacterium]|jgi:1-deoxy-D-xylulose-5-phosphate synthase|nr:1-deoxy-D-xylulose-5-phosphate synthase [Deferribacteraceae bacterium]